MKPEKLFFVFDVESIGLHGEGFAVGWVVVSEAGATYEESYLACLPGAARGSASSRAWVDKNIPAIPLTHNTPIAVRDAFWGVWETWKKNGAVLVADCCWPVEARFLAQCVDDNPEAREWGGPYPLHDVASALLARGEDPLLARDRLPAELPAHHPLKDAKQSARLLLSALGANRDSPMTPCTSTPRSLKNETG